MYTWNDCVSIKSWWDVDIDLSEIICFESVSSYSWGEVILIYVRDGIYYLNDDDDWNPRVVTEDEAIEAMDEFATNNHCTL